MINIYCDESCHLQYDDSDIMLLGAVSCSKSLVKQYSKEIRSIKRDYGLSESFEVKWTKVSPAKVDFYKKLLDYFFEHKLEFRCVIATGKKELDNEAYNQTYDDWYYKMYYLLLSKMIIPTDNYCVYIDIKDTNGGKKTEKLKRIINNFLYKFNTSLHNLQIVKSDEVELLQLCDLLIGCIGYQNRYLSSYKQMHNHELSDAKIQMCKHLISCAQRPLDSSTPYFDTKFNIFVWKPRK